MTCNNRARHPYREWHDAAQNLEDENHDRHRRRSGCSAGLRMNYTAEQTLAMVEAALAGFDPEPTPLGPAEPWPPIVHLAIEFRNAAEQLEALQGHALYISTR